MKRTLFSILLSVVIFCFAWQVVMYRNNGRKPQNEIPSAAEREGKEATHAYEAMRWLNDQRAYPSGKIPEHWRENALEHIGKSNSMKGTFSASSVAWTSVGPNNIAGRTRSIAFNPLNPNTMYCGSVSGGIWKSTNAGASWFPTSDLAANLVIGCIVINPADTNMIYAGTGEGYSNIDYLRGAGVLKSTDGGGSWSLLQNFATPDPTSSYYFINKLVIRSDHPDTLYAGMIGGVWKTTNAGTSWSKLNVPVSSSKGAMDLVMDPINNDILYASFGLFVTEGIYKTTNGGTSWSKLTNGFPATSTQYHRIALAISQSDPLTLYASLADSNDGTHSIQKTTNGGASWFQVATPMDNTAQVNGGFLWKQGWYSNVIAVNPVNPNIVFAGGVNLFKSTDGGTSWNRLSDGYGLPYVHVDQHAIVFHPTDPSIIFFGNDGGVFYTPNGGTSFFDRNTNLATIQLYSGAVHPTADIYYGGAQDNGIVRTVTPPAWEVAFTGDGGKSAVDYTTPSNVYSEYVFLAMLKSTTSGAKDSWSPIMNGIPSTGGFNGTTDRCEFIAPFVIDPTNPLVLVAGTYKVYRTSNGGASWASMSPDLTGVDGQNKVNTPGPTITALAIAKTSSPTIYAGTGSNRFGNLPASKVWVTTNTGTLWSEVTKSPLPDRYVSSIAIDPANRDRAFVCYSGYGTGHVFRTGNRGVTWFDVSGNLPDIPVNTLVIDPTSGNHLIAGTDLGIFETTNGGTQWIQQNSGLANVSIADLDLREDKYLFAATHGRGMFKSTAPIDVVIPTHLTIAVHQNPAFSQYIDVYVSSDIPLGSIPSVQITVGSGSPTTVTMAQSSTLMYKGSYTFAASGTATLSASATDTSSASVAAQRMFQVQFLKPGIANTIVSTDGGAFVNVPVNGITEETYFTVFAGEKPSPNAELGGTTYDIGPQREFSNALTISLRYDHRSLSQEMENEIAVLQYNGSAWVPISSRIDKEHHIVSAQVNSLGTFAVGYGNPNLSLPNAYRLDQNYPNPFNPTTRVRYEVADASSITMKVYDIAGREVATLVNEMKEPGIYTARWDASNQASGMYFCRMVVRVDGTAKYTLTQKMLLLK